MRQGVQTDNFRRCTTRSPEHEQTHVQVKCRQSVRRRRARHWKLQTPKTSNITNPFSSDIASTIYNTFIEQYLKSDSKNKSSIEFQLRKNIFLKLYQPHLISFIDLGLAKEQALSYKTLDYHFISSLFPSGLSKLFTFI